MTEEDSYSLTWEEKFDGYSYNRSYHTPQFNVSLKLSDCYTNPTNKEMNMPNQKLQTANKFIDSDQVILATSGINAISMALRTIMHKHQFKDINVIYSDELYCDTPRYIKHFNRLYGVSQIDTFDVSNTADLIKKFETTYKGQINIVFLESCSNPNGKIMDMSVIKKLRNLSKNLYVIVDNTWMTHCGFNPFEYDVDCVVASMSKHYSAGKCIAGFVIFRNKKLANQLKQLNRIEGIHISLPYCDIINAAIDKMPIRTKIAFDKTIEIANYLETQEKIINVNYPFLKSHPSYPLACQYLTQGPSILTFTIKKDKIFTMKWMKQFKIPFKTSFGSSEAKLDPWPYEENGLTYCRLALGYDTNVNELKKEFDRMLLKLK